ncbi:MAG TPA: adenylate/guanylate cyclase domain-containing protein [Oligoflexus sp.]|uniref:adenylate/guanylate cyclase domain-containing protein n=1 Tax=Oligoflexus sp. TaxID=1971216 RepID=UPI002D26A4A6|nr:adenylate/guanylate cyclase domain-containing protein [Oligoflexus sp.]HYX34216.1 adenylate/guanylate cyclase domain-containing protein [Oligoflexus sp.]
MKYFIKTFLIFGVACLCAGWVFPPVFAEMDHDALALDKAENLVYADPHKAVEVYQNIFSKTSPETNLKVWLRAAQKLNAAYFHINDLTEVPKVLAQVLDRSAQASEPELHAQFLIQQHSFLFSKGDFTGALAALESALRAAKASNSATTLALVQMYQSRDAQRNGHTDVATVLLHQALVTLKNSPQDARYYAMLNNIAFFLADLNGQNLGESLQIFAEITEYFDRHNLHFLGSIAYENYANSLVQVGKLDEAVRSYQKSLKHAAAIKDEFGIAGATRGMGAVYQKQKLYQKALDQYKMARPTIAQYDDQLGLAEIDTSMARAHLELGQVEDASKLARKWKSYIEAKTNLDLVATYTQLEAEILEKSGRIPEAMRSFKRLTELQRDMFDSKKQELTNRYYAEFEMERRNQQNLMLEHTNHLQSIEIDNQTKITSITRQALTAAVVAIMVLAFSFYRVQLSRRKIESLQRYIETNVLQRFLPPELVQEILTGQSRLDDRTKNEQVTILFADLCQFTRATDRLGPETISHILNDFFINMTDVIFAERGTIDKFIGDAIMVIFGAPSALPPDEQALAAVRCARKMQDKLVELNKVWELSEGQHFEMRIGIHQGQAVVGTFGGSKRSDYTVVGTSVNIAARVEGIAAPNSIMVTDAITPFLNAAEYTLCGTYRLRGLEMEIPLYKVAQMPQGLAALVRVS